MTSLSLFTFLHWRRKWQRIPVFLPGESQGRGSLVGCHLWGRTESDMTEVTQQQQQYRIHGITHYFRGEKSHSVEKERLQTYVHRKQNQRNPSLFLTSYIVYVYSNKYQDFIFRKWTLENCKNLNHQIKHKASSADYDLLKQGSGFICFEGKKWTIMAMKARYFEGLFFFYHQ